MARPLLGRPGNQPPAGRESSGSGDSGSEERLLLEALRSGGALPASIPPSNPVPLHPEAGGRASPAPGPLAYLQSSRELDQLALSGRGNWVPVFRAPPTKLLANHMQRASPGPAYSKPDRTQGRAAMNPAWGSPTPDVQPELWDAGEGWQAAGHGQGGLAREEAGGMGEGRGGLGL